MRFPHNNFPQDWSLTAGYDFGDPTSYGFHDGIDVNDKGGGDSDLGKPIFAEADGIVDLIHNHTAKNTFGNHYFLKVEGPWGVRWFHHAHCQQIFVKQGEFVKEGQLIAKIGNSGTPYAHDHWACCKELVVDNRDNVANSEAELNRYWEDPYEFIKKWQSVIINPMDQDKQKGIANLDQYRKDRKQGPEGSYEGYVNSVIGSDKDLPNKQKDLDSAKSEVGVKNGQIRALETTVATKDEAITSLKKQLKTTQDALDEAVKNPPVNKPLNSYSVKELVVEILGRFGFK